MKTFKTFFGLMFFLFMQNIYGQECPYKKPKMNMDLRSAVIMEKCRSIKFVNKWAKKEQDNIGSSPQFKPVQDRIWALTAMKYCKEKFNNECKLNSIPSINDIQKTLNKSDKIGQAIELVWKGMEFIPPPNENIEDYFQGYYRNEIADKFSSLNKIEFEAITLRYKVASYFIKIAPYDQNCILHTLQDQIPENIKKIINNNKDKLNALIKNVYQQNCPIEHSHNLSNETYIAWIDSNTNVNTLSASDINAIKRSLKNQLNRICSNDNINQSFEKDKISACVKNLDFKPIALSITEELEQAACELQKNKLELIGSNGFNQDLEDANMINFDNLNLFIPDLTCLKLQQNVSKKTYRD